MHDGEQQGGVGAGTGSDVAIGEFGGAGAGRVDDDEPAAALAQGAQLAGEVGGGGQTTVGHKGIRADDDEVVGAVEVGHGEGDRAAEHVAQRDVLGHLVERARAEHLAGAERADDQRRVQAPATVCAFGLPRYTPTDVPPWSRTTAPSRSAMTA